MKLPLLTMHPQRWLVALSTLLFLQTAFAGHHPQMSQPGKSLGVTISEIAFEDLAAGNLDYGVRIVDVMPGSPASAAGLKPDDVIVELSEKPVYSVRHLQWLVRQAPEGESVPVKLHRQDKLEVVSVTFQSSPPSGDAGESQAYEGHPGMGHPGMGHPGMGHPGMGHPGMGHPGVGHHLGQGHQPGIGPRRSMPKAFLGVQFQPMTPQLRTAFGVPADKGVLLVTVVEDGPAKQAGLAVGDVIVRMDRKTIANMQDIYRVLAFFEAGDEIEVEVIRDKTSQTLTTRLGELPMAMSGLPKRGYPHMHHPHARP